MEQLFVGAETARAQHAGPLGDQVDGFVEALRSSEYARASIQAKLLVLSQLTGWLDRGLDNQLITTTALSERPASKDSPVVRRKRLGGLLKLLLPPRGLAARPSRPQHGDLSPSLRAGRRRCRVARRLSGSASPRYAQPRQRPVDRSRRRHFWGDATILRSNCIVRFLAPDGIGDVHGPVGCTTGTRGAPLRRSQRGQPDCRTTPARRALALVMRLHAPRGPNASSPHLPRARHLGSRFGDRQADRVLASHRRSASRAGRGHWRTGGRHPSSAPSASPTPRMRPSSSRVSASGAPLQTSARIGTAYGPSCTKAKEGFLPPQRGSWTQAVTAFCTMAWVRIASSL
jgi:hypothetical protein